MVTTEADLFSSIKAMTGTERLKETVARERMHRYRYVSVYLGMEG